MSPRDSPATTPAAPALEYFATVDVQVGEPIDLGETIDGRRRIVPIRGGSARGRSGGSDWSGTVLDAGADFQLYPTGQTAYLTARYVVETENGTRLSVDNQALRTGSAEDLAKLISGEAVDPARIYFRCLPRITAPVDSEFGWVNTALFVGTGERDPHRVRLTFFAVA